MLIKHFPSEVLVASQIRSSGMDVIRPESTVCTYIWLGATAAKPIVCFRRKCVLLLAVHILLTTRVLKRLFGYPFGQC